MHLKVSFQHTPLCCSASKSNCRLVGQFRLACWCRWNALLNISHVFPACSSLYVLFSRLGVAVELSLLHVVLGRSCRIGCLDFNCSALSVRIISPVLLIAKFHGPLHTWALDLYFSIRHGATPFCSHLGLLLPLSFSIQFSVWCFFMKPKGLLRVVLYDVNWKHLKNLI